MDKPSDQPRAKAPPDKAAKSSGQTTHKATNMTTTSSLVDNAVDNKVEKAMELVSESAVKAFEQAPHSKALYELKVQYLGKTGAVSQLMREMKDLKPEDRPRFGQRVNEIKSKLETLYDKIEEKLKSQELSAQLIREKLDMTLPGKHLFLGGLHPVELVFRDMTEIFSRLGYSVRFGPLIEKDFYNFEALNMPKDHPARDMQDTFYIDDTHVLRTHTSPVQIRTIEKEKPPIRIIAPGAVFRCDSDISHLPMFHQVEGLFIDRYVSMADLKGTLAYFNRTFFGNQVKTRFRPSFFPFTEPSAEVDCSCTLCSGSGCRLCGFSGWIEVGGCGLVHPNVLSKGGIDPKEWQGFAFGMGVERLAAVKYGVEDIRHFPENDLRFLEQLRV